MACTRKNKKIPHGCGYSHRGAMVKDHHENRIIIAQCGEFGKGVSWHE